LNKPTLLSGIIDLRFLDVENLQFILSSMDFQQNRRLLIFVDRAHFNQSLPQKQKIKVKIVNNITLKLKNATGLF
jgi:hypothetical protein